ncbi:MAG: M14 family metallopeptidase [Pyrinomonadaceae bacterium]
MFAFSASLRLCGLILLCSIAAFTQTIPSPKDVLGWTPGDDRKLASWSQTVDYFKKLDAASDRVIFQEIGKTTMGAPFVYATISSPENLKQLKKYEDINAKLADPRKIKSSDAAAKKLIADGKTIVLITCGIHSTEVGSHTSSFLIAHRLASSNEPEILNILKNTIVLLVPSLNPDGVDIVKNWYDKTLGTPYEGTSPPELYHKYVGHDNNRDWYAFSQVETQLTVDKIHNVWHPQIVHDIHQQGANGSRIFLPPYMQPVEPNVPKQLVEGYTELGNYIAGDMRKKGFEGITTNSTYDAWTPARAYSHYHGGVRILSETASVRLASPINIKLEQIRGGEGYDARKEAPNFGPVWKGGDWKMRDITNYMTGGAFSLLDHAANNREKWLSRFYEIGKDAVRPRKTGEPFAFILPKTGNWEMEKILDRGGVEVQQSAAAFKIGTKTYPANTKIVRMDQPYGAFAKALLEPQDYPHLLNEKGDPISPYDVTAHTLPLLFGVEVEKVDKPFAYKEATRYVGYAQAMSECVIVPNTALYRSSIGVMDEGWTRWVVKGTGCEWSQATDKNIRDGSLFADKNIFRMTKRIVFPDQGAGQMLNGYAKGSMPEEYTGGIGKEGVANLKKFVEDGGTLVFLNNASDFAIEQFNLPVRDVTRGLPRKDFFIPGSILRTEIDTDSKIGKGMPKESIAWFEDSPAFEIKTDPLALTNNFRIIAKYPSDPAKVLLSGWALGTEKIAGKAALVEFTVGKGKIVLFGFRPQYRAQSIATYPLLFNAVRD